jgi:hypothetical protein
MRFLCRPVPIRRVITIYYMQHYIHHQRHLRGHNEHYEALEHSGLGHEHASLVHQELAELRQFASLSQHHIAEARRSGTRLSTAKTKLSTLVRYVYLSLF